VHKFLICFWKATNEEIKMWLGGRRSFGKRKLVWLDFQGYDVWVLEKWLSLETIAAKFGTFVSESSASAKNEGDYNFRGFWGDAIDQPK
jgi:hypothetical protein